MKFSSLVAEDIEKSKKGLLIGKETTLPKFDTYIGGLERARYDVWGGVSGSGKTSIVDLYYCISPIIRAIILGEFVENHHVIYFSQEITKRRKLMKWLCLIHYFETGQLISPKAVRRRLIDPLDYFQLESKLHYLDSIEKYVTIYEGPRNPFSIKKVVQEYANKNGSLKEIVHESGEKEYEYTPNNPDLITHIITDTVNRLKPERASPDSPLMNKKQTLDVHSENCIKYRDLYGFSPVDVNQLNRSLSDVNRQRFTDFAPSRDDFKESGDPIENADTVIALFQPSLFKSEYKGFDFNKLDQGRRFRTGHIIKNREGDDGIILPLRFAGEVGHFTHLPPAEQMTEEIYLKAMNMKNIKI